MQFNQFIIEYEVLIRISAFICIFAIMAIWEIYAPRRLLQIPKLKRWSSNIAIVIVNTMVLRLIFPAAAVGMAIFASAHGWGLFNYLNWPPIISIILSMIALDFIIYLQHVLVHAVPGLWRLHRVHHADLDFDLTTGSRFHPLEILISMVIKFAAISALGAPVIAVVLFEILLNGGAMFNHANIKLPPWLDNILRLIIVTPDMHRVHHSVEEDEANSNFGFNLSIWDRLFGTYCPQPRAGHQNMLIGIRKYRDPQQVCALSGMLLLPFKEHPTEYVINRRYQAKSPKSDAD